jgi:hypothetical protein
VQTPFSQVSVLVHALPSLQLSPSGRAGFEQTPVAGLHVPAVWHWSGAGQTTGSVPVQTPAWQVSVLVHALPSLQAAPSERAGFEQTPVEGLHVPALWHWSGVGQVTAVPVHVPFWHVSFCVQRLPSEQDWPFPLIGFVQTPVPGSHVPATWHWSRGVHVFGVPAHSVAAHRSPVVQGFPSSHGAVFSEKTHWWRVQASSVHGFPSSQSAGWSQRRHPAMPTCWQPDVRTHESAVHASPSSHSRGAPATHVPPAHVSPVVQALPSLHGAVLFA